MNTCFKFFASLKLAILLIVLLCCLFAAGTVIESNYGTEAAQLTVYRTLWFGALLLLLAINLLTSALDRIPWKRKHIAFLSTHLGIILILIGSLVSQAFGIEGQLAIREGETEGRMSIAQPLFQIHAGDSNRRWMIPLKPRAFAWTGREELIPEMRSLFRIFLTAYFPKAKLIRSVKETETGSCAVRVSLRGSMASADEWLFLDDSSRNEINLGPARIRFTREKWEAPKTNRASEFGSLSLRFENGGMREIELDSMSVGRKIPLKDLPYEIEIERVLKDAVVEGKQLIDRSGEWKNPAVELKLTGGNFSERHTLFSNFPDFPTVHGRRPSEARVQMVYLAPGAGAEDFGNELRLIYRAKELPLYQVKKGSAMIKEGEAETGKEIETGWMDFKFTLVSYLEHAELEETYSPLPNVSQASEAASAIRVEIEAGGHRETLWVSQGPVKHVSLGGSHYHLVYGLETVPLGFQVELRDFKMDTDPGTDRPASFKSEVVLKDPSKGIHREALIQMNEPLKHRGFKVFQSAYQVQPGEPDISIFTVAKDPGNPLKYAGAIITVGGIVMLFYVKPLSTLRTSDPKLRRK